MKQEYISLIEYIELNKSSGNDWFRIESDSSGINWKGKCWIVYDMIKYEFDIEFEVF